MAWTFVRPTDPSLLRGRPLLDLGTGDAQTILAVTEPNGLRVGVDHSTPTLRAARRSGLRDVVAARADVLPVASGSIGVVLAADLFHHTDDDELFRTLSEVRRVLSPEGRLIAWWYGTPGRGGPGAPRFPRAYAEVAAIAAEHFSTVEPIGLELGLEPSPPTVGMLAAS